jgi:coenzyme F420-reducing hydrogenase delta subunit
VIDTKQNKVVGTYKAKANPEVGLSPIEKLYTEDGMSSTHVGNKIVELFGQPKTAVKKETTTAKSKVAQDKAKETEKLIKDLQKQQKTFDAQQKKAQKEADAAAKKEADARAAELERLRKEQETQKETPKATQQISRIAEEIRAIDPDPDSEFSDVANMAGRARTLEEAMAVQDLAERLRRAYNTINSPAISAADKDAAANQVNKIYDELDAIQAAPPITAPAPKAPAPKKEEPTGEIARGLAESQAAARAAGETKVLAPEDLPIAEHERILQEAQAVYDARDKKLNKQEVKEAIEENGNAKEATKISNELKNQACD